MGAGNLTDPVSVRARFERFPATVKGAFILRGEDADPHQVVFREANVVGLGLGVTKPMPMTSATLDVAPHRDVFVPFEMPVSELEPGWYTMTCDLEVDGVAGDQARVSLGDALGDQVPAHEVTSAAGRRRMRTRASAGTGSATVTRTDGAAWTAPSAASSGRNDP